MTVVCTHSDSMELVGEPNPVLLMVFKEISLGEMYRALAGKFAL